MVHALDETDELLNLKVQSIGPPSGKAKLEEINPMSEDARRWKMPPGFIPGLTYDKWGLRVRLYELMRQAIYQARNAMIIMQIMREKYHNSSLYKMGFLICKTDNAVKTFMKFAFRAFRNCGMTRAKHNMRSFVYDVLLTQERLVHLWFNAQLLIELIIKNDRNCASMLKEHDQNRNKMWKFED